MEMISLAENEMPAHYCANTIHQNRKIPQTTVTSQIGDNNLERVTGKVMAIAAQFVVSGEHLFTKDTPLMEAAGEGQTDMVRALLACGADKSLANHRGSTANELAADPEIKAMLR